MNPKAIDGLFYMGVVTLCVATAFPVGISENSIVRELFSVNYSFLPKLSNDHEFLVDKYGLEIANDFVYFYLDMVFICEIYPIAAFGLRQCLFSSREFNKHFSDHISGKSYLLLFLGMIFLFFFIFVWASFFRDPDELHSFRPKPGWHSYLVSAFFISVIYSTLLTFMIHTYIVISEAMRGRNLLAHWIRPREGEKK